MYQCSHTELAFVFFGKMMSEETDTPKNVDIKAQKTEFHCWVGKVLKEEY